MLEASFRSVMSMVLPACTIPHLSRQILPQMLTCKQTPVQDASNS